MYAPCKTDGTCCDISQTDVYKRQVMIGGHESFLFNEDEKWFVEAKEQCL